MPIPTLKQIHLRSHRKESIFQQFENHIFTTHPHIVHVAHLIEHQEEALAHLEAVFKELHIWGNPYPIFILSSVSNYQGSLLIVRELEDIPEFYGQKQRTPNAKESTTLKRIELKQKNLQHFYKDEINTILYDYTHSHKKLLRHAKEGMFLENFLKKQKKDYGQS